MNATPLHRLANPPVIRRLGTATAIAMTQKDGGTSLPLIGTEETAPAQNGKDLIPDSAEEIVPGMNNLEDSKDGQKNPTIFDEPAQKTE